MPRIRLCDADRERYGGPEWVEIMFADVVDEETGIVELIEERFDLTWPEFSDLIRRYSTRALRAMIWVARYRAGVREDPRTFRPRVLPTSGIRFETLPAERLVLEQMGIDPAAMTVGGDADPPVPANRAERRARTPAKARSAGAASKP